MSQLKHIFYIQSDFHYMICKSIIALRKLDNRQCFFVCRRGMTVEEGTNNCDLLEGKNQSFFNRVLYLVFNYEKVKRWFGDGDVVVYLPFRFLYPSRLFVKEIVFYEEGFSAYKTIIPRIKYSFLKQVIKDVFKKSFAFLLGNSARAFLMYTDLTAIAPKFDIKLYICTPIAYSAINNPHVRKELLPISCTTTINYNLSPHSYFIVLERFSEAGRTCTLEGYKRCVKKMFDYCTKQGIHEIWTKFHPADWTNSDALNHLMECNKGYDLDIHFFDGRLEFLALQNRGIVFLSTSSTILYYAPILGNKNESLSFCKYLASIDDRYNNFMQSFGGIEKFVEVFSENVNCIDLTE